MSANNRYERTESSSQWVFESNEFKLKTEIKTYEFDGLLHDWVKTKTEEKFESPHERGMLKTIEFLMVFPDDSEPNKQFGKKSKKAPNFLYQVGTVMVRPEYKNVWLIKQTQRAIQQEGATGQNRIYVKCLDSNGLTYKFEYLADERVSCSISDEKEVTVNQLKELEAKGAYIIYCGKALYSEERGFEYGQVAYSKAF